MSVFRVVSTNFYQMIVKINGGGRKSISLEKGGVSLTLEIKTINKTCHVQNVHKMKMPQASLMTSVVIWHNVTWGDKQALRCNASLLMSSDTHTETQPGGESARCHQTAAGPKHR